MSAPITLLGFGSSARGGATGWANRARVRAVIDLVRPDSTIDGNSPAGGADQKACARSSTPSRPPKRRSSLATRDDPRRRPQSQRPPWRTGLYVGTNRTGIWIAWNPEDFERMCRAFDAMK